MISTQLQVLIPSKCPGVVDKVKVTSASEPSAAKQKKEMDMQHKWDLFRVVISVCFFCSITADSCSFRSAAVDTPPAETVASLEISAEDLDIKEITPAVVEEMVKEAPTPVAVQPPHTSPKPSFASEVSLCSKPIKLKREIKKTFVCTHTISVFDRDCWESSCWRPKIWLLKTTWWVVWWKERVTPMPKSVLESLRSRAAWSKRISTQCGMRCMMCVKKNHSVQTGLNNFFKCFFVFWVFLMNWTVSLGGAETWVWTGASESPAVW